ncbi:M12 family metallopeptidase [Pseudomonas sp.]|uniref:M12 family metallopeptidase n=1 Tax=Pseudomonas sp. TaxID=306 RepID=UPI0026196295|nr:M12 family metallopeptidase [Pseudomonas sp.]
MMPSSALPHYRPALIERPSDEPHEAQRLVRNRRNIGEPAKYWPQNSTVKIAIFDYEQDDPYVLALKEAASKWLPHINLKFEFVAGEEGDVRIAATPTDGGGSTLGTAAQNISPGAPTMTLPADHTRSSFESTVLHEFGHMLGAHHAHQHPEANIPWHQPSLDRHLSQPNQQENWLPLPRSDQYEFLPYDSDSIMHYSINPELTTQNTFYSRNSTLSDGDIAWAKKAYPKASPST